MKNRLSVSLIIPVYNDAEQLFDCLLSVAAQSVRPDEVIVVDNNSSDGSVLVALNFPFVTLLREPRQGVRDARARGFNAARGDILARIDADTQLRRDWVARVHAIFAGPGIDLVTGAAELRGICLPRLSSRVDLFWRRYLHNRLGSRLGLQGANMALRRQVWQDVRDELCQQPGLHEDFDIGIHAVSRGYHATFDEQLAASLCHRQLSRGFDYFYEYAMISPRTYQFHELNEQARQMYPVIWFLIAIYPLIWLLTKGYDAASGRFSVLQLLAPAAAARVNPATFSE